MPRRQAKQAAPVNHRAGAPTNVHPSVVSTLHVEQNSEPVSAEQQHPGETLHTTISAEHHAEENLGGISRPPVPASRAKTPERRRKTLNIYTYKFHSYGDYARTIRIYGTMDSYSTEPVRV